MNDNNTTSEIQVIAAQFFAAADVDYIGFWEIVVTVRQNFRSKSDHEQRTIAIEILKALMGLGLVVFTFERASDASFSIVAWEDQDPETVAIRAAHEWGSLPADPDHGDICWLKRPSQVDRPLAAGL